MSDIKEIANKFFTDCETGKGWESCKKYCAADATFSSHAEPLLQTATVEGYADWMAGQGSKRHQATRGGGGQPARLVGYKQALQGKHGPTF